MNNKEALKNLFFAIPPQWDEIRTLLDKHQYSKTDLAEVAIALTDNCQCEYMDATNPDVKGASLDHMHSNHVYDAIKILLDYGLDPNEEIDGENVMWNTHWIEAPNVAARVLRLLLEHGGNPNIKTAAGPDSLFEYVADKVSFDQYTHYFLYTVQCWLVLVAYGGCYDDRGVPLTMLNGHKVEIFKDYEKYDFKIDPQPEIDGICAGFNGPWTMSIYNISTGEIVARY